MTPPLAQPQRLHPFTLLLGPLRAIRGWLVPIVIALALRPDSLTTGTMLGGLIPLLAIGVAVTVVQAIQVLRVRWWVSDGAFQMRVGVLQLEARSVPVERIQNVDVVEPLLPRVLGLAEVKIETAGSSGGDLALRYVTLGDANRLRETLVELRPRAEAAAEPDTPSVLVETGLGELLIAGATANRVGTIVLILGVVWGWVVEAGVDPTDALEDVGATVSGVDPAIAVLAGITFALAVGWIASIGATLLKYHGFRLTEQGADLRRQHGLLSRSSGIIPLKRVQAVRIERPWLRRLVHRASIVADSAGSVAAATNTGAGVVAPIIHDRDVAQLIERVLSMPDPASRSLYPVSRLAIRRGFVRAAVPIFVGGAAALVFRPWWALAAIPLLALAYLWATARFRALGYRVDDDLVIARSGILTRRQWMVPASKVQSTVTRSTLFQRRLGLATLSIDTAGPGTRKVTIIDLESGTASAMAERMSSVSAESGLVSDGV